MYQTLTRSHKKRFSKAEIGHFIFYIALLIIPILHFFVFYLYVNINSFVMAFQTYTIREDLGKIVTSWAGFKNFEDAWSYFSLYPYMFRNSLIFIAIDLFISQPLAIIASYYIYKKKPCSGFFRTVLYLPQVLSSIVLGLLFKFVVEAAIPQMLQKWFGVVSSMSVLDNPSTQLYVMALFSVTMGFGVNVLLYSNAMGNVNPSNIESAQLDGANTVQILWHVILPKIWPTIVSLTIVILSQVFTSQFQVFNIYGENAQGMANIGYQIYVTSLKSNILGDKSGYISYPALAAFGLTLTAIIVPVVFLTKYLMNRFGPRED